VLWLADAEENKMEYESGASVWLVHNKIDLGAVGIGAIAVGRLAGVRSSGFLRDVAMASPTLSGDDRIRAGLFWRERRRPDQSRATADAVAGDRRVVAAKPSTRSTEARSSRGGFAASSVFAGPATRAVDVEESST